MSGGAELAEPPAGWLAPPRGPPRGASLGGAGASTNDLAPDSDITTVCLPPAHGDAGTGRASAVVGVRVFSGSPLKPAQRDHHSDARPAPSPDAKPLHANFARLPDTPRVFYSRLPRSSVHVCALTVHGCIARLLAKGPRRTKLLSQ